MTAPYPVSKAASLPDFQNGNDKKSIFFVNEQILASDIGNLTTGWRQASDASENASIEG